MRPLLKTRPVGFFVGLTSLGLVLSCGPSSIHSLSDRTEGRIAAVVRAERDELNRSLGSDDLMVQLAFRVDNEQSCAPIPGLAMTFNGKELSVVEPGSLFEEPSGNWRCSFPTFELHIDQAAWNGQDGELLVRDESVQYKLVARNMMEPRVLALEEPGLELKPGVVARVRLSPGVDVIEPRDVKVFGETQSRSQPVLDGANGGVEIAPDSTVVFTIPQTNERELRLQVLGSFEQVGPLCEGLQCSFAVRTSSSMVFPLTE